MISLFQSTNNKKNYHLFVSHAWDYKAHYYTIEEWLKNNNITFSNYSVPKHAPLNVSTSKELKNALYERIRLSSGIIIIAGMYVAYSEWIDYELELAYNLNKPIIAIRPRGQERIPKKIQKYATTIVGWNSNSLIDAIKNMKKSV